VSSHTSGATRHLGSRAPHPPFARGIFLFDSIRLRSPDEKAPPPLAIFFQF
jgi:hypothetical protein